MTEENEVDGEALLIRVREGRLEEPGSWLYVWLAEDPRRIVYVGGTGMPPVLRTWRPSRVVQIEKLAPGAAAAAV